MNAPILASRPAAAAPLGVGVLCTLRVEFRPICDGRQVGSPDGRFVARATSTFAPRISDGSRSRYDFVIEDRAGTRLQHIEITMPRNNLVNWRLEGLLSWADDSSTVTFEFTGARLTLSVAD